MSRNWQITKNWKVTDRGSGSVDLPNIDWPGGSGWIVVNGVFTAPASIDVTSHELIGFVDVKVFGEAPSIAPAITAAGVYPFSAPQSVLQFQVEGLSDPGANITNLDIFAIAIP